MTREEIYNKARRTKPPELFKGTMKAVCAEYDEYIDSFDLQTREEAEWLMGAMEDRYEKTLKYIHNRTVRDYRDGKIYDVREMPLLTQRIHGRKTVTNIPYIIADWIGLILYVRKKISYMFGE